MNRRKLLYFPFLIFLFSLLAFTDIDDRKSVPAYLVIESKKDMSLSREEAVFELFFYKEYADTIIDSIQLSYNENLKTVKPDQNGKTAIIVKPGKYKFQFYYNSQHFEITTDSILINPGFRTKMQVNFESSITPKISLKPVIYFYPEKTEAVEVSLKLDGELGFTYPQYENGWKFTADPDGTIHQNGKEYDYLFWDGKTNLNLAKMNLREGFLIDKDSLVSFFETKLSAMGLSPRETEDYITFWVPMMQKNERNYIHFLFNEEYNEYASLTVKPKPDKLFRVYMVWSKADADMKITEQKIESFSRSGFTVVEWGGAELDKEQIDFAAANYANSANH